jgi:hypothetical protein
MPSLQKEKKLKTQINARKFKGDIETNEIRYRHELG